ncbi:MAG: hypothetical protein FJ042_07600 [Candidatus Cloacimonetes bacterium]|nr:hypothetical protein [Candidatus Cloacimonadota bacterium]
MKQLIILAMLFIASYSFAQVLTCYNVQYTTNPSGDSPYKDQVVTVEGIVTGTRYYTGTSTTNYGFFLGDAAGGPWSGLFVFTNQNHPQVGDLVRVTGTVVEYYSLTEMTSVTQYSVISSNNSLPPTSLITTGALTTAATGEQWESVFVKVQNVNVTALPNNYQEFYVNDGTGACQVDDQFFDRGFQWTGITSNQFWAEIKGLADYSFNYYAINPRSMSDMVLTDDVTNAQIRIQSASATLHQVSTVNVLTSRLKPAWGLAIFETRIKFDSSRLEFHGIAVDSETITTVLPEFSLSGDTITVIYESYEPIFSNSDDLPLFRMLFKPISYGEAAINFLWFKFNNIAISGLTNGKINTPIRESIAHLRIGTSTGSRNSFNPSMNERINIEYGARLTTSGINAKAIVRIYDAQGRLKATLVNKNIASANGIEQFIWDGRDSNLNRLPIGVYYCHVEMIDRNTGRSETTVQPIVIKSNLK